MLPVNGIPLTVTRTYDSLNPRSADFGYSWTMALNSMDIQLDEQRQDVTIGTDEAPFADDEEDDNGLPKVVSIRTGGSWDVTLTLPEGRRTTFAFDPHFSHEDMSYHARWTPPPDVHYGLNTSSAYDQIEIYPALHWREGGYPGAFQNYDVRGWVLTNLDGTVYNIGRGEVNNVDWFPPGQDNPIHVQACGPPKLTSIVQRTGDRIEITDTGIKHYDPSNHLTRSTFCTRDQQGRVIEIRDPISGSNGLALVRYIYNQDTGNLIQVLRLTDRTAGTYTTNKYHYDNANFPHYITSIENSRGVPITRNLFDDQGRLIGIIDVAGRTNLFSHDVTNRIETIYNRKGVPKTYAYDARGNLTNVVDVYGHGDSFTYDDNGVLTSHTDPLGRTTLYTNDSTGNVLSVTVPHAAGADPALYTTHFTYDSYGNQTSVLLPTGGLLTNAFDAVGNLIEVRDGSGNLISRADYDPATGLAIGEGDRFGTNRFGYDSAGNVTSLTNVLGKVTSGSYDLNGQLITMTNNGTVSTVNYDALGRETTSDLGHGISLTNGYASDSDWLSVDGPTVGHEERHFDDQNRLAGWTTLNGSAPAFAYDENGALEYETNCIGGVTRNSHDPAGRLVAVTNFATGAWTTYDYDAAGQRVGTTNSLGEWTRYGYHEDGSLAAMTNTLGHFWLYTNAAAGSCCGSSSSMTTSDPLDRQVVNIVSELGLPLELIRKSGSLSRTNKTTYLSGISTEQQEGEEYPETLTDEGGRARRFAYTELGQLERATDLGGITWWTNQYDADSGALTNIVSPTGETLTYSYDDLDNIRVIRYGDGSFLTNNYNPMDNRLGSVRLPSGIAITNLYDEAGRLTNRFSTIGETASFQYNLNDMVTVLADNTGSTTNLYDSAGRLYGIDFPSGAGVRYELDLLDRITNVIMKASQNGTAYNTRYWYDGVGNVTNILDPLNGSTTFEYDALGRKRKRTLPNNVVTTYDYDEWDQFTNIVHKLGTNIVASFSYERAQGGEPTKISREDGTYVRLEYDSSLRLTNEVYYNSANVAQDTNSYGYDASGTRTRFGSSSQTLTNAVQPGYRINQVKDASNGSGVETYEYDNGGRVTNIIRQSMTLKLGYSSSDQVNAATNGSLWVTYLHDAQGRRTISTNSSGIVRWFVVAQTPETDLESPLLVANAAGTVQQGFVYLGHRPLLRFDAAGNPIYYLEDAMGSIAALADNTGAKTASFAYDGFGNFRSLSGSTNAPSGAAGDFRFQGAWLEDASGLYNMRAREYDPRLGRFTSRDPNPGDVKSPESQHPYGFAASNPYVYADPSGEYTLIEMNIVQFLQVTLRTLRTIAENEAKQYAKGKLFDAFGKIVLKTMDEIMPGLDFSTFDFFADIDPLGTGSAFDLAVRVGLCETIGKIDGGDVGENIHFNVRVVNRGPRLGDPISAGRNCKGPNPRVLGRTRGSTYSIPDFIFGPTPLTHSGMQRTYFTAEVKSRASTIYKAYISPGTNKRQLDAILGYTGKHTYEHISVFVIANNNMKRGLKNRVQSYFLKRILTTRALSKGVIPIIVAF